MTDPLLLIAGPTASGKSGLAVAVAEAFGGVVINADSMQVYRDLRILTARPSPADEARVPHALYGVLDGREGCSVARWLDLARTAIAGARAAGRLPILVGGTGLYLKALTQGLSPVPDIPPAIRSAARALLAEIGNEAFHVRLGRRDPVMASRLSPGNTHRLLRAWEVLEATGRSLAEWQALSEWQAHPHSGGCGARALTLALLPPREGLRAACDRRFLSMVEAGALAEVAALAERDLDPSLPVLKALGVPELRRHLSGEMSLDAAITLAQTATRRYAKRQVTWIRHQLSGAHIVPAQYSESLNAEIFPIIHRFLLTGIE